MSNINSKTKYNLIFALGILAILALLLMTLPMKASAEIGYVIPYNNPENNDGDYRDYDNHDGYQYNYRYDKYNSDNQYDKPYDYDWGNLDDQNNYQYDYSGSNSGAVVVAYNSPTPSVVYSNNQTRTQTNTVTRTIVENDSAYSNTTSNTDSNTSETQTDSYSNLASNAFFGGNAMLPSGLLQWIFLAILVLIVVILVRRTFGATDNYNASPMKHV